MTEEYTYTTKAAKQELKVSDCKLMHLREDGIIRAIKKGRAFLYNENDIEKYKNSTEK